MDKGPGDVKYPKGKPRNLKKMPDGNPYPYERTYEAEEGVFDDEIVEQKENFDYTPKPEQNIGDEGRG